MFDRLWKNESISKLFLVIFIQPFQAGIYHCHLYPLQAANCCRDSRLVVDEDDLMWFENKDNYHVFVNQFHGKFGF